MTRAWSAVRGAGAGPLVPRGGASGAAPPQPAASLAAALARPAFERATRGPRSALPFRSEMERAFGEDFAGVRAYTGRAADVLPAGARALTAREAIAFADRAPGRETVAHELAHVVQARNAGAAASPSRLAVSEPGQASEREARGVGRAVAAGGPARVRGAVGGTLHGDWLEDVVDLVRGGRRAMLAADPCASLAAADAFVARGRYGPRDVIGSGGLGGFSAYYDPRGGPGMLTVEMRVAVRFHDTLTISPAGTVVPGMPAFAGLAARLSALTEPRRSAAVSRYQWSPAERGTGGSWITALVPLIRDGWGGRHRFFLNLPQHEWIGAEVRVDLQAEDRARAGTDHMQLDTWKFPPGESLRTYGEPHQVEHGGATDARDQTMQLASTSLGPKEYDLLRTRVLFGHDSAALDAAARTRLAQFIGLLDGALGHAAHQEVRVVLEARASASGDAAHNLELSRRRAEAVRLFLDTNGFHNVATRVVPDPRGSAGANPADRNDPNDRRVELVVDGGERMNTAAHEFGHAFGLDDEYAGTGRPIGSEPRHHAMARNMTDAAGARLPGAVVEHNGGIMSWGNEVRPRHYAAFHHALTTVTSEFEWALGAARARSAAEAACTAAGGVPGPAPAAAPSPDAGAGVDAGAAPAGPADASLPAGVP